MPFGKLFKRQSAVPIDESPAESPSKSSLLRRLSNRSIEKPSTRPERRSHNGQTLVPPSFAPPAPTSSQANNMGHDAAPPSYSEAIAVPTPAMSSTADDPFAFLTTFDTAFLIDDSGSMNGRSWAEVAQALAAIAPICAKHDKDGVDVHFMNAPDRAMQHNLKTPTQIREVFDCHRPYGPTPTGTALNKILRPYVNDCEQKGADRVKPLNIIVITDGVATDDPESVIIQAAKRLEKIDAPPYQVGIQFFQVGNEPGAAAALKELDDGLVERGCERDIVDTVPYKTTLTANDMLKVVLGAVNRRLDRKSLENTRRRQ